MRYEISKDHNENNSWRVQVADQDGTSYSAYFVGPQSEQRAKAFVDRKNSSLAAIHQRAA